MNKTGVLFMTVVTLSALSVAVFADGARHAMMGGPMLGGQIFHMMKLADELDLSKEQRTQIDRILDDARPRAREYVYALGDGRDALRTLSAETEFDESRVRALAEQHAKAMVELIVMGARVSARINTVLTPEQRETLLQMRASHGGRKKHYQ
jgi:protein CpxP